GRLVDAVAPRRALAVVRLAAADPHEIRIVLRYRDVADRDQSLRLELRLERRAAVRGLPYAAVRGTDVEDRGIRLVDREVRDAPRHRRGTDRSEVQSVERTARRRRRRCGTLADERLRGERCDERREQCGEAQ